MPRNGIVAGLILIVCMLFIVNIAQARDVVILYDTSGSLRWHDRWREVISDANNAISDLFWEGQITKPEKWTISQSPTKDKILANGQSMVDLKKKDILIVHEFDEPDKCEKPFFTTDVKVYHFEKIRIGRHINNILPSERDLIGPYTFISLAKWSAANYIAGNSSHPKESFYLILVSDMREEMEGKCQGSHSIARTICAFETFYIFDTFFSARYKKVVPGKTGQYITIQASLVTYKEIPKDKLPHTIKEEDNPIINPPEPVEPVIIKPLPEPREYKPLGPMLENNDHDGGSNAFFWILLAVALAMGGIWAYSFYAKKRRRGV